MTTGDSVRHELTGEGCWKGFRVVAEVTALHIVCHVATHPCPPKVMGNEFCCLPSSGVASHWIVMVSLHDVEPELIVLGDVDLSSVEY